MNLDTMLNIFNGKTMPYKTWKYVRKDLVKFSSYFHFIEMEDDKVFVYRLLSEDGEKISNSPDVPKWIFKAEYQENLKT